jgi:hypothetical protein
MPKVEEVATLILRSLYTQSWSECIGKHKKFLHLLEIE